MGKEILFSVTAADCDWSYTKGTGAGGQKRNKTSSAVHCTHRASGARGYSESSRSQHENKRDAFIKMTETKEFKDWHAREVQIRTGAAAAAEAAVQRALDPRNLKVEGRDEEGRWVDIN